MVYSALGGSDIFVSLLPSAPTPMAGMEPRRVRAWKGRARRDWLLGHAFDLGYNLLAVYPRQYSRVYICTVPYLLGVPPGYAGIIRLLERASHSFFHHLLATAKSGETEHETWGLFHWIAGDSIAIGTQTEHRAEQGFESY